MLKKNILLLLCSAYSLGAFAFDLEDYATTYRATKEAYLKAANELQQASAPFNSARDSYRVAASQFIKGLGNGKDALDKSMLTTKKRSCVFSADLNDRTKDKVVFETASYSPDGVQQPLIDEEITARTAYFDALKALEQAGKAKAASVKAYSRATNEYLHSLSTPMDLTLIKRTDILNKK